MELIRKPKLDYHGRPVNPDERPMLRVWQAYQRYKRRGKDEETATRLALREPGKCYKVLNAGERSGQVCGSPAITSKGYTCAECKRLDACARSLRRHKEGRALVEKTCQVPGCKRRFKGHHSRVNCDIHLQVRIEQRSDAGTKRVSYKRREMPPGWEKPAKKKEPPKPKAEVIIKPANVKPVFVGLNWSRWP